jgi:pimeloyl-ACP methyl ester carboxylesterase
VISRSRNGTPPDERRGRQTWGEADRLRLTGEYDYSCTVELSQATAEKIPGVKFQAMPGIRHFPSVENPRLFAEYLLPVLQELSYWSGRQLSDRSGGWLRGYG